MNEINEFKWLNWHEWIETNELKRMNWNEWFVDLILKKWSEPVNFLLFLCEIELSLHSRAQFVDLNFKKSTEPVSTCDTTLEHNIANHADDENHEDNDNIRNQT